MHRRRVTYHGASPTRLPNRALQLATLVTASTLFFGACKASPGGGSERDAASTGGGARDTGARDMGAAGGDETPDSSLDADGSSAVHDGSSGAEAPTATGGESPVDSSAPSATATSDAAGTSSAEPSTTDASSPPDPADAAATGPSDGSTTPPQTTHPNLGIEPEMLTDLSNGGQVYGHTVSDDWFYFAGLTFQGTGLLRMPKRPGVIPELISEDWSGSTIANFHFDGEFVYFLDERKLTRFDEELSQWTTIDLERTHYYLGGDHDSVFAMGDNCEYLTIFDRETLTPRTFEPVPGGAELRGGAFGITSDGEKLYCTGASLLYIVDKASGDITTLPVTWGGPADSPTANSTLRFRDFFFAQGKLNAISDDSDWLGEIDVTTGVFTPLARDGWNAVRIRFDTATGYFYLVEHGLVNNVWRYDPKTTSAIRLMPTNVSISLSQTTDSSHIYFIARDNPIKDDEPIGIMRVAKPPPPSE